MFFNVLSYIVTTITAPEKGAQSEAGVLIFFLDTTYPIPTPDILIFNGKNELYRQRGLVVDAFPIVGFGNKTLVATLSHRDAEKRKCVIMFFYLHGLPPSRSSILTPAQRLSTTENKPIRSYTHGRSRIPIDELSECSSRKRRFDRFANDTFDFKISKISKNSFGPNTPFRVTGT